MSLVLAGVGLVDRAASVKAFFAIESSASSGTPSSERPRGISRASSSLTTWEYIDGKSAPGNPIAALISGTFSVKADSL